MSNFFKIMMAVGTFTSWAEKATADGKIDVNEVTELVTMVLQILGVKAEIKL
jgi:hypothetical protein